MSQLSEKHQLKISSPGPPTKDLAIGLTGDQETAFNQIKTFLNFEGGGFFLLTGVAGTGKTFLMGRVLEYIAGKNRLRVACTAPTHKAVKVLATFVENADLFTTHAYLGMREQIDINGKQIFVPGNADHIPADNYQIVIVDEASMVADEIFDELEELLEMGRKILFVGDPLQIPPINHRNSLPFEVEVQRALGFQVATLTKIVRQAENNPIIQFSSQIRKSIYRPFLPLSYENHTEGLLGVRYTPKSHLSGVMEGILEMFASPQFKEDPDYIKILAWTNETVDTFNTQVRAKLFGENIPKIMPGDKLVANAPIKEGKTILVKNNEDMEVLAVEIKPDQLDPDNFLTVYKAHVKIFGIKGASREAIISIIHEDDEKVHQQYLDILTEIAKGHKRGSFQAKSAWMDFYAFKERYADVKYAYAITTHKAQGSTYDHAVIMMWDILSNYKVEERNRILYTAVTRPKYSLRIIH